MMRVSLKQKRRCKIPPSKTAFYPLVPTTFWHEVMALQSDLSRWLWAPSLMVGAWQCAKRPSSLQSSREEGRLRRERVPKGVLGNSHPASKIFSKWLCDNSLISYTFSYHVFPYNLLSVLCSNWNCCLRQRKTFLSKLVSMLPKYTT